MVVNGQLKTGKLILGDWNIESSTSNLKMEYKKLEQMKVVGMVPLGIIFSDQRFESLENDDLKYKGEVMFNAGDMFKLGDGERVYDASEFVLNGNLSDKLNIENEYFKVMNTGVITLTVDFVNKSLM